MNKKLRELLRKADERESKYPPMLKQVRRDGFKVQILIKKSEKIIKELESKS